MGKFENRCAFAHLCKKRKQHEWKERKKLRNEKRKEKKKKGYVNVL
jgi:hypothetical protein